MRTRVHQRQDDTAREGLLDCLSRLKSWPSPRAKRWVYDFSSQACHNESTCALLAVGSIARPVKHAKDVDLLYIYRGTPLPLRDHPLDVDIRAYDAQDVRPPIKTGQEILGWALRFGCLLCEHDEFWTRLSHEFDQALPMPDPRRAESRADVAERRYRDLRSIGDEEAASEQLVSALTNRSWAHLVRAGVYPASRSELPSQLRAIHEQPLADALEAAIKGNLDVPIDEETERRIAESLHDFAVGRRYGPFETAPEMTKSLHGAMRARRKRGKVAG